MKIQKEEFIFFLSRQSNSISMLIYAKNLSTK